MGTNIRGLILLEGSDGTGKTTLAQEFVQRFDAHYMHLVYRWPSSMWTYHAAALNRAIKLSQERLVILDRQWVSNAIYGTVFKNQELPIHGGRLFDRVLLKHGAVYIFCLVDNFGEYQKRYEQLKQTRVEKYDNVMEVAKLYEDIFYGISPCPLEGYSCDILLSGGFENRRDAFSYFYQRDGDHLEEFTDTVAERVSALRSQQYRRALHPLEHNFLGHAGRASYMVIGDKINREKRAINYPWYANKNSSLFLSQCLSSIGMTEPHLCYTNVNDPFGVTHALEVLNKFDLRPIVLGKEANKIVNAPPECVIPHPSYGRRFLGKDQYTELLRETIQAQQ